MRDEGGGAGRTLEARGLVLIAATLLMLGSVSVSAQRITVDPTRPPPGFGIGAADPERDNGSGIRLQSVMISPRERSAIINGVLVRLGEKYGDAVLVGVAENGVVLKSGSVHRVLRLHPDVEMRVRGTQP